MNTYLAIDLGTSNCRSAVFNEEMELLSISSQEYPLFSISAEEIEQDAEDYWQAAKATIRRAVEEAGEAGRAVAGISISSQGITFIPVDESGKPLDRAISWLDTRAVREEAAVEDAYGLEEIFRVTGKRANGCYTLSKLMWYRQARRDIYEKAYRILLPMDYLIFRLCGRPVTDHTMAAGTMFYDIGAQDWSEKFLAEQKLDREKLPEICWAGTAAGKIDPALADELGLSHDVVIAVGAQDQKCASLGAGISSSVATASLGTASCIERLSDRPVADARRRIPLFSYLWPGAWAFEGIINTAASSYQWFRNNFAKGISYPELDVLAAEADKKGERCFFFPYLAGMTSPFWGDMPAGFTDLSLATDTGQLAMAVMDGVACNIRANLEVIEEVTGASEELRLFGGGAVSPFWCRHVADITGKRVVTLRSPETALAGAAMLACKAVEGDFPKLDQTDQVYEPDAAHAAVYEEYYQKYLKKMEGHFS